MLHQEQWICSEMQLMADQFRIPNWNKWQSYRKDRGTPPWIKIHRSLLSNHEWASLTDSEKGQLVSIWIVAADKNGTISSDPNIIRKICMLDKTPNVNKFIGLGFLVSTRQPSDNQVTTTRQPSDPPETETETDKRQNKNIDQIEFDRWWACYPKKVGKKPALKIWKRIKPDVKTLIEDTTRRALSDSQWLGGFIPNPATYLNQERWNDELQTAPRSSNGTLSPADEYALRVERENKVISEFNADVMAVDGEVIPPSMGEKQRRHRQSGIPRLDG